MAAKKRSPRPANRPTRQECLEILDFARAQAAIGKIGAAQPGRLFREMEALNWITPDEMRAGLVAVLGEVQPKYYAGHRPPELADELECLGCELFAFCWPCKHTNCKLYLKFVRDRGVLKIVSIHESKPKPKRR